jgi:hypothetical protein
VLYSQLAAHEIGVQADRASRLDWASERLHKSVSSFKDLSGADAGFLIDSLQGELGVKVPARPRKRLDRVQARRAGLDGRKDDDEFTAAPQMASAADLTTIESYYARLDWSRAQFDGWLRSPRSPLKCKSSPAIVTLSDANRVRWALKGMLQHAGKWQDRSGL